MQSRAAALFLAATFLPAAGPPALAPGTPASPQVAASGPIQSPARGPLRPRARQRLFAVTTDDAVTGALVDVHGAAPWRAQALATTRGGQLLRRFGRELFVIETGAGRIRRVPLDGGPARDHDLGAASEPQDVLVWPPPASPGPQAWVTRRANPFLHRIDLESGLGVDVVDLSPVGGGDAISLGTLARDGTRLFVQVKVSLRGPTFLERGVLAVVDLPSGTLIDVEPLTPGIQGIALAGAPPRLKMQILPGTRTLFVSTTDGRLDNRGGIERVDLDALASDGYALDEETVSADLGGFVMTSPQEGYFVFHTDIVASTHLKHFTVAGGPDPGFEILVLLGDDVDVLAHDPLQGRVFLPSAFASFGATPGIYVIDTATNQVVDGPIDTLQRPHDVLVGP